MARRNKINRGFAFFCAVLFLAVGVVVGVFGKVQVFASESYVIPETINVNNNEHSATTGIDVDVIKENELSIHFLELGNKYTGDCTLIKVGNTEVLIDAGSRASSVKTIYDYVSNFVDDGVVEYVIVTHAHQDHYACFATGEKVDSLFDLLVCKNVITFSKTNNETSKMYENFERELEETKTKNATVIKSALDYCDKINGTTTDIDLGAGVSLSILYQKYYEEKASTENNYSVCCMLNQGADKHYLFTGDLEADGEESLVDCFKTANDEDLPQMEIYKAGHHGSKTSSSDKLLKCIQPQTVCVCCCAGSSEYTKTNANQFPTQEFIDRVAKWTSKVFVTTLCINYSNGEFESFNGNIVIAVNYDKTVNVYCSNNAYKLKDTAWFKENRTMPEEWAS